MANPDRVECEVCANMGRDSVVANNQIDGVWACVDCIVEINKDKLRDESLSRARESAARDRLAVTPSVTVSAPAATRGVTIKAPIANAQALVSTLSVVMERMLAGEVDPNVALAACKLSAEAVKAMDLMWRMSR